MKPYRYTIGAVVAILFFIFDMYMRMLQHDHGRADIVSYVLLAGMGSIFWYLCVMGIQCMFDPERRRAGFLWMLLPAVHFLLYMMISSSAHTDALYWIVLDIVDFPLSHIMHGVIALGLGINYAGFVVFGLLGTLIWAVMGYCFLPPYKRSYK